jgi:hypothetical protein
MAPRDGGIDFGMNAMETYISVKVHLRYDLRPLFAMSINSASHGRRDEALWIS